MPGEINVPVVGKMSKTGVVVTVAAGVAVIGFVWWKKKETKASVAVSATTAGGTAGAAAANSYGYSSANSNPYGYGVANPYGYGSTYGYSQPAITGGDAADAYGYYAEGNPNTPQTNAAWTQECVSQLGNDGYDAMTVTAACGIYLTGGNLTAAQASVIQACIGVAGYPPTEGPSGFPPQMHTGGTTTTSPPTTTTASNPAYGQAGPPNNSFQAITTAQASTLESAKNYFNKSGEKAQRPFIWNGSNYVPNTNPINPQYQYYAGPLENQEINTYVRAH
jgi:hypothetical protein